MVDQYIKIPKVRLKFHVKVAIIFMLLGFFFINFSLLENSIRQALSFSLFGVAIVFSSFEYFPDLFKRGYIKGYVIGGSILLYVFFFSEFVAPYGDYGKNKYLYFLFVSFMGFIAFPPLFKYEDTWVLFSRLIFYVSVVLSIISILYADPNLGRRGEFGLNPAILARLCMICGIYITCVMYCRGVTVARILILLLSISAVFFTATKTPVPVYIISFYLLVAKRMNIRTGMKLFFGGVFFLILMYLVLVNFVPQKFSERILDPNSLSSENQSTEGNRYELYGLSVDILEESMLGHGFGGFAKYHSFIVAPHNIILEISIELGMFATVFFLIWLFAVFRRIKNMNYEHVESLFLSTLFLYFVISALFGGELTIQNFPLYLIGSSILLFGRKFQTR